MDRERWSRVERSFDAAAELLADALAVLRRALPPDHPGVARLEGGLRCELPTDGTGPPLVAGARAAPPAHGGAVGGARTWRHAGVVRSAEAVAPAALPARTRYGVDDWERTGWGGPCPPIGRHRYFFKLHALDAPLGDLGRPTRTELEKAMAGHVLGRAERVGTDRKQR